MPAAPHAVSSEAVVSDATETPQIELRVDASEPQVSSAMPSPHEQDQVNLLTLALRRLLRLSYVPKSRSFRLTKSCVLLHRQNQLELSELLLQQLLTSSRCQTG